MSARGRLRPSHDQRDGSRLQHVLRVGVTQAQTVVSGNQLGPEREFGPPAQRVYKPGVIDYRYRDRDEAKKALRVIKMILPEVNEPEMYHAMFHYIHGDVLNWDEQGMKMLERHVAHFWRLAGDSARFKNPVMMVFNNLDAVDKTSGYITERAFSCIQNRVAYTTTRHNSAMMATVPRCRVSETADVGGFTEVGPCPDP